MNQSTIFSFLLALVVGIATVFYFSRNNQNLLDANIKHHMFVIDQAHSLLGFDLVDPEQAPLKCAKASCEDTVLS